jgi:hypothetical protein
MPRKIHAKLRPRYAECRSGDCTILLWRMPAPTRSGLPSSWRKTAKHTVTASFAWLTTGARRLPLCQSASIRRSFAVRARRPDVASRTAPAVVEIAARKRRYDLQAGHFAVVMTLMRAPHDGPYCSAGSSPNKSYAHASGGHHEGRIFADQSARLPALLPWA